MHGNVIKKFMLLSNMVEMPVQYLRLYIHLNGNVWLPDMLRNCIRIFDASKNHSEKWKAHAFLNPLKKKKVMWTVIFFGANGAK